jgi:AAA domain-containing protein
MSDGVTLLTPDRENMNHQPTLAEPCPNKADISGHLYALFNPSFVLPYPDAWIEIAFCRPDGTLNEARNYSAFQLKEAAAFAEAKNQAGCNVYVGAALRKGKEPRSGRASDANFQTARFAWAEFDGAGDAERIDAILKENHLTPAMVVTTGTVPHLRAHLYFKIADGADQAKLVAALKSLKASLKSDDVDNASRVMRLAGTVSYPAPKKATNGYVPELVTLHKNEAAPTYQADTLIRLAPGAVAESNVFTLYGESVCPGRGRSEDELLALLASINTGDTSDVKWHKPMLSVTASMAGLGWSEIQMRAACASHCKGGANDPQLIGMIRSAIAKYQSDVIDDDVTTATTIAPTLAIPLDYYDSFGTAVAKDWITKGVIAVGETSSWIGRPGSGKSALLADLVVHIASGTNWRGHLSKGVRRGVVYFALERGGLVKRRLVAHAIRNGAFDNLPIAVASQVIDLFKPSCAQKIVATIREAEAHMGCPVGTIVIDTYGKGIAAGGGDEDKAKDQNRTLANLRRVHEAMSLHIAIIGHTGKDESRGARGSNAHLGDVDMMVQLSGDKECRIADVTKDNDGAERLLTRYRLEVIELGTDEDGDAITTAIVSGDMLDSAKDVSRAKLSNSHRKAMTLLERCIVDGGRDAPASSEYPPKIRAVTVAEWRTACVKGGLSGGTEKSAEQAFRRAMSDLDAMRRIGVWDGLVWIAYD